jgi:UDP-N-acetylglucosamine transferase subunit ALG13
VIVVTVGTQLPFDRLIRAVDAAMPAIGVEGFAQTGAGSYQPHNMPFARSLPAGEFDGVLKQAQVIVGHAGIGTILMAQKLGKPIVVMPRLARHGEHRNDHQLATVAQLRGRSGVEVAADEAELLPAIRRALDTPFVAAAVPAGRERLKGSIDDFIMGKAI